MPNDLLVKILSNTQAIEPAPGCIMAGNTKLKRTLVIS